MAIDYSQFEISKGRPRALDKADRKKRKESFDAAESARVKVRSGGRCEVIGIRGGRCPHRASEVHHLLGGSGRRAVGESAKAENKLHVCAGFDGSCHKLITGNVLVGIWTDVHDRAATIRFQRYR